MAIPADMLRTSLGCGNPIPAAALRAGETVLDLGCGTGVDLLLAAHEVRPGLAIGLDLTWEMLELARRHQREAMTSNVALLRGVIEQLPIASESVDVVMANGVLTLSVDKLTVIREVSRVLKCGGRFVCADAVIRGEWSDEVARLLESSAGCVGGALDERVLSECLRQHGFKFSLVQEIRAYELARFHGMEGADVQPGRGRTQIQPRNRDFLNVVYLAVKQMVAPRHW